VRSAAAVVLRDETPISVAVRHFRRIAQGASNRPAEGLRGEPIWDVVASYLRAKKSIAPPRLNLPVIRGMEGNAGIVHI
jgi:hypothetical protein